MQECTAEKLVGSPYDGLHWTCIDELCTRNRDGYSVTIPSTVFQGVTPTVAVETVARLNRIEGHHFLGADCVAFVERAFGGRRLFADSPRL